MFINANPCMKFRHHKRVKKNPVHPRKKTILLGLPDFPILPNSELWREDYICLTVQLNLSIAWRWICFITLQEIRLINKMMIYRPYVWRLARLRLYGVTVEIFRIFWINGRLDVHLRAMPCLSKNTKFCRKKQQTSKIKETCWSWYFFYTFPSSFVYDNSRICNILFNNFINDSNDVLLGSN